MYTLAILALLVAPTPQWRPHVRQPSDTPSASAALVLHIEPSESNGLGPMKCRLARGKEVVWSHEYPWTFEQAAVAEDGTVVGYANAKGVHIVVLDPKGDVRKVHVIPFEAWIPDGDALPWAMGRVLIHEQADLAFIRVRPEDQSRPAPWKTVKLSTGEFAGEVRPECPAPEGGKRFAYERDARVVGDTGLILCQWWFTNYEAAKLKWTMDGGIFTLVDLKGASIWSVEWLDDYTDRSSEKADDLLAEQVRKKSPILSVGPGNRFALWNVKSNERVEFAVERDESASSGWTVTEIARKPIEQERPKPESKQAEMLMLKQLGTVAIGKAPGANTSPIRDISTLGFTDDGDLEIFRRDKSKKLEYARLKTTGEVVFERDLSSALPSPDVWISQFFDLSGERWLLQFSSDNPSWLELDVKTGATKPCALPDGAGDADIATTSDGGYLALIPRSGAGGLAYTELLRIRRDGSVEWRKPVYGMGPDDTELELAIGFGRGVASVGEHTFAVLAMQDLSIFELDQQFVRKTALDTVIGHSPSYLSHLLPDRRAGVYFHEGDRFWHVDAQGNPAGSIVPRRPDGSPDDALRHGLRVAPDGRLWTEDNQRIYRLAESGIADLVLGPTPRDNELTEPSESLIDDRGRILMRDRFSQALHVFDTTGAKLFVCTVSAQERIENLLWGSFHVKPDGTILMATRSAVIRLDARGEQTPAPPEQSKVLRNPERAILREMDKSNPEARALKSIRRRPDGNWIVDAGAHALLKDGRRALTEQPESKGAPAWLYFYSPKNEPLGALELPMDADCSDLIASERWIVIGSYHAPWTLVRIEDQKVFRFDPALAKEGFWHVGQSPDGRALLLLNTSKRELVSFELP